MDPVEASLWSQAVDSGFQFTVHAKVCICSSLVSLGETSALLSPAILPPLIFEWQFFDLRVGDRAVYSCRLAGPIQPWPQLSRDRVGTGLCFPQRLLVVKLTKPRACCLESSPGPWGGAQWVDC